MDDRARFHNMIEGQASDWQAIMGHFVPYAAVQADRVLAHLRLLEGDHGGFPVDRLTHSLQTATRALRDGRDEQYVVCALLHDIGDTLAAVNHPEIAAAIVKPYVRPECHWMVQHHGIFQGHYFWHHIGMDRDARDAFRDHPHYALTEEFCRLYDAPAFDPAAETLPLESFEPMVRRVFALPASIAARAA